MKTRCSAITEEPRDALRQLKYYGRFLTELLTRSSASPEEPYNNTIQYNIILLKKLSGRSLTRIKLHVVVTNDQSIAVFKE